MGFPEGMHMALLATRASKNPADWSDKELLKCVLRNDARGWAELVRRYRPLIYRCITKVTLKYAPSLSSADLDEIYADVMMQLVRDDMHKLRIYNPARGTKLGSWIGMISVNAAYDFLRSAGRRPLLDKVDGVLDPHEECDRTPLDQLIEKERWEHLNDAALRLHRQGPHVRRALLPAGHGSRRDRGRDADQPEDGLLEEAQDPRAPRALPRSVSPARARSRTSQSPEVTSST